ncbi:dihydroxyacetone kinase subunit DhaK [Flaviflagellibacter deserti]|uniref:Dihydroxyacetone kinase subunit DhaK n=1 Tax=Flaviflagellibacter deserti TaxID=2267266 RepID=A0ABV9YWF3_9HYPH
MKHVINERDAIVTEAVDGAVLASGGMLTRLDGYPNIKVALRTDWDRSKVAIISGGGSGHEPAHVGFVGQGMLTAAVCGEIFASPSVDAVLAAILAVTGPSGCLLIVKNYTGDRLNFGLAAEKARARGLDVEMVIVGDDVATAGGSPRGIAGTVLVHKAAGHAAEQGGSLAAVRAAAEHASVNVFSLGLSLSTCEIPGQHMEARLGSDEVEMGLGIHGEPGVAKVRLASAEVLVAQMLERMAPALARVSGPIALLLNNLGGLPAIEMAVVTRVLLAGPLAERVELVVGPAPLMTSLDMKGFSVTVLVLDDVLRSALRAPTTAPAWPGTSIMRPLKVEPMPAGIEGAGYPASEDRVAREVLTAVCDELMRQEASLNALDARVGDGDTGSTFGAGARQLLADMDRLPLAEPAKLCRAIAERLSKTMGGSSGVLLSIFAAAAGKEMERGASWPDALRTGVDRMQHYGGAKEGERTMIDALLPALRALQAGDDMAAASAAAEAGAKATESIGSTRSGRSSYLNEADLIGVRDPGAAAVAAVFARLAAGPG